MEVKLTERVRFGEFEFDLKAGELRQGDRRVVLREQPFQILRMLVEHRGQVVTREEIRKKLWPNDTVVEFDHSVQAAISRLRQALGDSAGRPKYIETVARRGYRLIVKVEWQDDSSSDSAVAVTKERPSDPSVFEEPQLLTGNLVGKKVSHYRLLEILGGGGMGVVYKAEDLKLGRRVAMKFLPEECGTDATALERFEREARAASALDHPGICAIHEFGEHGGQPFLVMPLLEGMTLRELIAARATPLPIRQISELGIEIASGLEAAHEKGIIHRDIKPANIFITNKNVAKILDFGVSKVLEADEAQEFTARTNQGISPQSLAANLTRTGMKLGTAGYMSPEQVRGERLDARTDIFSLGIVLYEMATGKQAFVGETASVVQASILNDTPKPVGELNPNIPHALERIIAKALEKDRHSRYQSAAQIIRDLKSETESLHHRNSRYGRWLALIGSMAAVTVFVATVFKVDGRHYIPRSTNIHSIAVFPLEDLSSDTAQEYFVEGLTDELTTRLASLPDLKVIPRASAMAAKASHKSIPQIGKELGADTILEGTVERSNGQVRLRVQLIDVATNQHLWTQSYERKLSDILAVENEFALDVAGQVRVHIMPQRVGSEPERSLNPAAFEDYLKGRYFWNRRDGGGISKAVEYFQRAIQLDPDYAPAYAALGESYILLGDSARARLAAEKGLSLDPTLAEAHTALALVAEEYWNFEEAEREYKVAISLNPNYATAHHWYGQGYLALMGRFEEADREMKQARALDPVSRIIDTDCGAVLYFERQYDKAYLELSKVLEMEPGFTEALRYRGLVLLKKGKYSEAIADFENARRIDNSHRKLALLGYAYGVAGRRSQAAMVLRKLNIMSQREYVDPISFAMVTAGLGQKNKSFAFFEKAYSERSPDLRTFKVEPMWDLLRDDRRFSRLLTRIGISPSPTPSVAER